LFRRAEKEAELDALIRSDNQERKDMIAQKNAVTEVRDTLAYYQHHRVRC
jgi:hypothetical protein